MSTKFRRGLVAAATPLALVTSATPAMAQEDGSNIDDVAALSALSGALSGTGSTGTEAGAAGSAALSASGTYLIYTIAGIAVSVAFWGTVYNALVSRGTVPGQIIPQLPVL